MCVTNSPGIFHSCKQLYSETQYIKFAVGYNPQQSIIDPFSQKFFQAELQNTNYIGEVGLDFSKHYKSTQKEQIDIFSFICELAAQKNKLLSVHSRKAEKETLDILLKNKVTRAIIHWYSGDIETFLSFLEAGYYFSVNASMCTTQKGQTIVSKIPPNRLLIESDGPFSKVLGKRYVPLNLSEVYTIVETTTGYQNLKKIVWENFKELLTK